MSAAELDKEQARLAELHKNYVRRHQEKMARLEEAIRRIEKNEVPEIVRKASRVVRKDFEPLLTAAGVSGPPLEVVSVYDTFVGREYVSCPKVPPPPPEKSGSCGGRYKAMKSVLAAVDTKQADMKVPRAFGPQRITTGDKDVDKFLEIFTIDAAKVEDPKLMRRLYTMLLRLHCYKIKKDTPPWCVAAAVLGFAKEDFPDDFKPSDDNRFTGLMRLGLDGTDGGGFDALRALEDKACRSAGCKAYDCNGLCISSGSRSHYYDGTPFVFEPCVKVPMLPAEPLTIGFRPDKFDATTGELMDKSSESSSCLFGDGSTKYHYGYGRRSGAQDGVTWDGEDYWTVGDWSKWPALLRIPFDEHDFYEYDFRSEYRTATTERDTMVPLSTRWAEKRKDAPRYYHPYRRASTIKK